MAATRATVAYVRVSTDEQARDGESLADQRQRIETYANVRGWTVRGFQDAGESGKSLKRPAMEELLGLITSGAVERVVVTRLDRLTRNVGDLQELLERFARKNVALVVLDAFGEHIDTATATGRMLLSIVTVMAQWERETSVERVTGALAHRRRNHRLYGSVPFGYRCEHGMLIQHEIEQAIIRDVQRLRGEGWSYHALARELNQRRVLPHRGKKWYASSVQAMLNSKIQQENAASAV
jgi:site-specific DNA recombinase